MGSLKNFIMESLADNMMKLSPSNKRKLIELDKEFNRLSNLRRDDYDGKAVLNVDSEWERFMEEKKHGEKYFPVLKMNKNQYDTDDIIPDLKKLYNEFAGFRECFLSKYYMDAITWLLRYCQFFIDKEKNKKLIYHDKTLDEKTFDEALKIISTTKVTPTGDLHRDKDAKYAGNKIKKALDELGYDWKVVIKNNMMARMNVDPAGNININKDAKFSDVDIDSLIAHEVKGHIGRRYYGYQTGLYLFVHGLYGRNTLDEGLAIWNSLNLTKKPKPNLLFTIALKYVIVYLFKTRNFCDVYNYLDDLIDKNYPRKSLFKSMIRAKRENRDCSLMGGSVDDTDYFYGYTLVKRMDKTERENILKYNVGVEQLYDIDNIKKFLDINKFEPLKM